MIENIVSFLIHNEYNLVYYYSLKFEPFPILTEVNICIVSFKPNLDIKFFLGHITKRQYG